MNENNTDDLFSEFLLDNVGTSKKTKKFKPQKDKDDKNKKDKKEGKNITSAMMIKQSICYAKKKNS